MSPKAVQYRANSIIYFKGDQSDRIFLLNAGRVNLSYVDIETGQEVRDLIKMGEFFGVKSALGHYMREETAIVLQDSTVMVFSVPEFEAVAMKNTRIITKMLAVFSNQLRRIHRQVQNLMVSGDQTNPETGLYQIGEYYLKNKRFGQALYAFKRYLVYYPTGAYATDVTSKIVQAEEFLSRYGSGVPASPAPAAPAAAPGPAMAARPSAATTVAMAAAPAESSEVAQTFYNAVSLVSQEKYLEAYKAFKKILEAGPDPEYTAKAEFEMAKCLFYLKQFDNCIKSFSAIAQKFPKHPELKDALFFVGRSYEEKGDKAKAGNLYKKIISMGPEDDPVVRKVRKALRAVEGAA
ncbi:MAG TPA: cyclic nucleotide-binding domain-containing protein [Spirochaetia bacterium]|nr:cyclic nucleotide-binding domain-containing protein [Spirochaetia bacterium]